MKNMVTTEEALKELISMIPDEVLSEAIGGMSARSRDRLIKLGLVATVAAATAAAGYGGYRWYNSRKAKNNAKNKDKGSSPEALARLDRVVDAYEKQGIPVALATTTPGGGTRVVFDDEEGE